MQGLYRTKILCNLCIWKQPLRLFLWHRTLGCFAIIHLQHRGCHCISWPCYKQIVWSINKMTRKTRSQDWPDLPLQNKWPELCWGPDYKFSTEMFLQFQAPAQNWKEGSIFISSSMEGKLMLNVNERYKLQEAFRISYLLGVNEVTEGHTVKRKPYGTRI